MNIFVNIGALFAPYIIAEQDHANLSLALWGRYLPTGAFNLQLMAEEIHLLQVSFLAHPHSRRFFSFLDSSWSLDAGQSDEGDVFVDICACGRLSTLITCTLLICGVVVIETAASASERSQLGSVHGTVED